MNAFNAGVMRRSLKGLDPRINPDKPPRKLGRNFGDAMKALDKVAWAAAYNSEYLGFKQREVFKHVKPARRAGAALNGGGGGGASTPPLFKPLAEECVDLTTFSFKESDLYAPVLKATEARLLLALAAAEGAKVNRH